jgi:hypothetical protein
MKYLKTYEEVYYDSLKDCEGYVDANDDEDKEEIISADEVYFNATEEGNWEIWAKNPKYKIEKSFENVDMMNQIWNQFMDTIKECFIEFEDEGWYWSSGSENPNSFAPHFRCIMLKENDEYVPAELRKEYIDWTGRITSDGEIIWDTKDLTNKEFGDITDGPIYDRAEDFLTSVKRLQSESGLDFNFSYNNRGGEMKIIIQGRI